MSLERNVLLFFLSISSFSEACIALGCLGVGCLPPPPCIFPPCLRQPVMGCPCGPGLQCISGGCVMAKARGAKTYQAKEEPAQQVEDPNSHFLTCCNLLDVPEDCYKMCSYEGYKKDSVSLILDLDDFQLLASLSPLSKCPLSALPQIHFCAARGTDHTRCCREAKVPSTCEVFCDQRPGNVTNLNFSHLQCFERFDDIKGCFLEHSLTEYYEAKHRYRELGKLFY